MPESNGGPPPNLVTLTIDGQQVSVPKGTLIVEAAKRASIEIPVFCYHHKLNPVGACRLCLVEVAGSHRPLAACVCFGYAVACYALAYARRIGAFLVRSPVRRRPPGEDEQAVWYCERCNAVFTEKAR